MGWISETIKSSKHILTREFAAKITVPVKIFNAGDDRIVNADAAETFCDYLDKCSITNFADSRHCINRENYSVFDQILDQSVIFFDRDNKAQK